MPHSHFILTQKVRRAIMISFVIAYFLIAPIIILYTAGYRYDFKNKQIKQTGVISVDIEPSESTISVNNISYTPKQSFFELKDKTNLHLPNRAPGTYELKISKENHLNWSKTIQVESNKTTYIKDVKLIKNPVQNEIVKTKDKISLSPYNPSALLISEQNDVFELIYLDLDTQEKETLIRYNKDTVLEKISWSPYENKFLAIHILRNEKKEIVLFDVEKNEHITYAAFNNTATIQWRKDSKPSLYIKDQQNIASLTIDGPKTIYPQVTTSIWFVDEKENLWTIDPKSWQLTKTEKNGKNSDPFLYTCENEITKIVSINEKRAVLQNEQNLILLTFDNDKVSDTKTIFASNYHYNPFTQEIIAWSDFELWSIFADGTSTLLTRSGNSIQSVRALDNKGVLLLMTKQGLEAFNAGYFVTTKILPDLPLTSEISVWQKENIIFFTQGPESSKTIIELPY